MENRAIKKVKKVGSSLVFGRFALIAALILIQVGVLYGIATILREYAVYLYGLTMLIQLIAVLSIINERGNQEYSLTWFVLLLVSPVFGSLFYIFVRSEVGWKHIGEKIGMLDIETRKYMTENTDVMDELRLSKNANVNLAHYMGRQMGFPTYRNTQAEYYPCGEEFFPVIVEELQKAKKYIFMEYFIVSEGIMWNSILEILKKKVSEGVEVRFMYDGTCSISHLPYDYAKRMNSWGIHCKIFGPIRPVLSTTQNHRDHRKICVIDGKVAFTGGLNLADEYINEKERFGYWKDTAIMLKGDAVQSFTIMFLQLWNVTENRLENYENYLTPMSPTLRRELGFVIPYSDSPYDNENVGLEVYLHILNHAKKYVHIMTPYLIPDSELIRALIRAAKGGVDIKIIMPHIPDKWYAFAVAKTYYRELIEAGVKIYEFLPGFVHAKSFVSDDDTAVVGTVNLDYRSLYLHFECGAFLYNNPVVKDVEKDFNKTLRKCHKVTVSDVKKIDWKMKLAGSVFRLIAPLM